MLPSPIVCVSPLQLKLFIFLNNELCSFPQKRVNLRSNVTILIVGSRAVCSSNFNCRTVSLLKQKLSCVSLTKHLLKKKISGSYLFKYCTSSIHSLFVRYWRYSVLVYTVAIRWIFTVLKNSVIERCDCDRILQLVCEQTCKTEEQLIMDKKSCRKGARHWNILNDAQDHSIVTITPIIHPPFLSPFGWFVHLLHTNLMLN